MAPAGSRLVLEAIQAALVLLLVPPASKALVGFGGVTGRCTRSIAEGLWHSAHVESSVCAPPTWPNWLVVSPLAASAIVTHLPVSKLMPSWQPPQARRFGTFFQLSPCAVLAVEVSDPSWHFVQLRMSCGNSV